MKRLLPLLALALAACAAPTDSAVQDLTSATARERLLAFEGYVYVHPDSSDADIVDAVHQQTRSAFGALTTQHVSVATRELAGVDPAGLDKQLVDVVDGGEIYQSLRVRYRYTDRAVVPKSMARRSAMSLGLLHGDYQLQADRILAECTLDTANEREMQGDIWYVFNPALAKCKQAMRAEQGAIDTAREDLDDPSAIVPAELERLYIPMTVSLGAVPAAKKRIYPEYDQLWSGGVVPGKLVVTLLDGMIDHAEPGKTIHPADDSGYWEMLDEMGVILDAFPGLKVVATEPPTDLGSYQVDGTHVDGLDFRRFVEMELYNTGYPSGLTAAQKKKLRRLVAERIHERWIVFEEEVQVSIGGAPAAPRTVQIQLYFGVEEDIAPYRRAIRQSDVFLYNGHSYIGEGPLDPANFGPADFPQSYQLFFIDSCLSFNYYNGDYFTLKSGGTAKLDVISNGLESYSDGAGAAQGQFVVALLGGALPTYLELLEAAATTGSDYAWGKDALRVVDGELDNTFKPSKTRIELVRQQ